MFNAQELRGKLSAMVDTSKNILNKADREDRALTRDETRDLANLEAKMKDMEGALGMASRFANGENRRGLFDPRGGSTFADAAPGGIISGDGPYHTLGSQLRAVIEAGRPGGRVDERLFQIQELRGASGMGESVPSEGGFAIQPSFSTQLLDRAFAASQVANRCTMVPVTASNQMKLPAIDEVSRKTGSRYGGIQMFWLGEGDAITPTKPKLRMNLLNLKKLAGVVYLTDELLADAAALQAWTERCYIAEASFMLDLGVIAGAGGAEMLGILNSAARVTVPKETGQSAATFQYENACNMYSRLLPGSIPNAVWFIHSTVLPQLYQMNLKIGTAGAPVFQPQGGASGQPYSTLFGRPVQVIEQASTLGTEGDAIFMDCGRYLVADRGAVQTAYSIHVRFLNDENVLRVITRTDGIPELASPITPYSGSVTQSAYVTLANR